MFILFLFLSMGVSNKTFAYYDDVPARQVDTASAIKFTDAQTNYFGGTALDSTGKVWTWGWNGTQKTTEPGMLGIQDKDGNAAVKAYAGGMIRVPYFVENGIKVEQIEAGYHTTFAIDDKGQLYAWGKGEYDQIGDGISKDRNPRPINISAIDNSPLKGKKIVKVAVSSEVGSLVMALDDEGNVYGWGRAALGDFPGIPAKYIKMPVEIPDLKNNVGNIVDISYGRAHGLALNDEGKVFVWGANNLGQHGNGTSTNYPKDRVLEEIKWFSSHGKKIKKISTTSEMNLILTEDDEIYQIGIMRSGKEFSTPTLLQYDTSNVGYIPKAQMIEAGKLVSYFIDQHGRLWSWGDNNYFGFFLDGPWLTNKKIVTDIAKIQPDTMGDGDTEENESDREVKTPVFSSKTKPTAPLSIYKTDGMWSNINRLHPTIYDKKYMKTVGEYTGKNLENHSKVFPIDKKGRKLVYTIRIKNKIYEGRFLVANDSYQGDWYLDLSSKETNPLPTGLTDEVSYPEIKESERSWIGLSVDLDSFDYTANHMQSVPYMTNVHTFQSSSMLLDNSGNLYKSSLDGSGSIAWGWDVNYAYDGGGFSLTNPQDGLYNFYNYELTFMRGAPRIIPGAISINNTLEKNYLTEKKTEKVDMKLDIGMAYTDPQLNITVEPSLKQVKAISMPLDQSSDDYKIKEPSYIDFMNAYDKAEEKGYHVSDIAKKNNWEGITHHVGEPPIETLKDNSIEVSKNSVVWLMLQTETYSNTPTVVKRIEFDNFYDDASIKSEGALLKKPTDIVYDALPDNVSKSKGEGNKDKYGFPLDINGKIIKDPTFGYDEVKVKKIENNRLDQLDKKPKFSHMYTWAEGQSTEKVYKLNGVDDKKNSPTDITAKTGELPVLKEFNHKFYYEINPDIYFTLHYVAVDKNGKKLPSEEFDLPNEELLLKEIDHTRTAPPLKVNQDWTPVKYKVTHSKPTDVTEVTDFKNLNPDKSTTFSVPYDTSIKDVTLYYLYDENERDVYLNVRQVVLDETKVMQPSNGYLSYQMAENDWKLKEGVNQVRTPSQLSKDNPKYRKIKLTINKDVNRLILDSKVPQYYQYVGYKQSNTDGNYDAANIQKDKKVKVDYSDDAGEKWLTVYIKPTTNSPDNYSWQTEINNFGKLPFTQSKTVKIKFYSKKDDTSVSAKLMDFLKDQEGLIAKGNPNIKDYYFKMNMPDGSGIKKLSQGETISDIILKNEKDIGSLPESIPIKVYFTNSAGNEEESFFGKENGISGTTLAAVNFKVTKKHTEVNEKNHETTIWYYYDCEFSSGS